MQTEKKIGWLLIAGAIGVFIPYTILTMTFEYPDILRQDIGVVLTKFHTLVHSISPRRLKCW